MRRPTASEAHSPCRRPQLWTAPPCAGGAEEAGTSVAGGGGPRAASAEAGADPGRAAAPPAQVRTTGLYDISRSDLFLLR